MLVVCVQVCVATVRGREGESSRERRHDGGVGGDDGYGSGDPYGRRYATGTSPVHPASYYE